MIIYKKLKLRKPPEFTNLHQVVVMCKSVCKLAWKKFENELNKSVSYKTRNPHKYTIHFILLTQILGVLNKNYHLQLNKYNINKFFMNKNTYKNHIQVLNNLLYIRPHFFCINCAYLFPEVFNKFKEKYLIN